MAQAAPRSSAPEADLFSDFQHYLQRYQGTGRSKVLQIKNFLQYLFERQTESSDSSVMACMTPEELTGMFQCSLDDVEHALHELSGQGYTFRRHHSSEPLIVKDALAQ